MKVEVLTDEQVKFFEGPLKVTTCGNVIETMAMEKLNRKGSQIIQLGDYKYILKSDIDEHGEIIGEVKEFKRTDNRGQNLKGMARSMKDLRDLINCNVTNVANCRWVTLTYRQRENPSEEAVPMTDTKRLYEDMKNFYKRLKYHHEKNGLPPYERIDAVEPQGSGSWHVHSLWIYDKKAPYIANKDLAELWGQGFVTIKKLDDVDNVGAYLTAYLCDVEVTEALQQGIDIRHMHFKDVEVTDEDGQTVKKRYIKGARLHMYPAKMNFYRTSRGVKRPSVEWLSEQEAKEKVKAATLTFSKNIRLTDEETDFTSDIQYRYYNTIRKCCQDDVSKNTSKNAELWCGATKEEWTELYNSANIE